MHAFVFPGQGAEEPGMGLALAARSPRAARLLGLASEVTGVDVPRALERGGRALERTEVLQPVLLAVSLGSAHAHIEAGLAPDVVVGHSLGELGAAALALGLDDEVAITLAAKRGELMAAAARAAPGGMCALRGTTAELDDALRVAEAEGCVLAAENTEGERVVSGPEAAIVRVLARLGVRASRLRTVGPWHSPAMLPAVAPFRAHVVAALGHRPVRIPFVSAVGPSRPADAAAVADVLARGLVEPVRFAAALGGIDRARVLSPSRTLRSLVRRALPGAVVEGEG